MFTNDMDAHTDESTSGYARTALSSIRATTPTLVRLAGQLTAVILLAASPAAAQVGSEFCDTAMAGTIKNLFTLIQFGGPLIGGVLALAATVMIPVARQSDRKRELKSIRNQGLIYGVLVAPLGTEIVTFLLNNVVVGGSSCGF